MRNGLVGCKSGQCDVSEGWEVKQLWASDSWECAETQTCETKKHSFGETAVKKAGRLCSKHCHHRGRHTELHSVTNGGGRNRIREC